ncbi:phosphatidylinositol-glycan biosynthesis class S protein [Papiliotrema laurentii]|uniref:Phosphatidylinositol-glycan biosynthesis class S protein n=1 Tax=Papiliotrema laurentii TaxID=5418 RepID=A0AAD9FQF5_PAPLA|nr:phosphatidylinositol-glycan biosynthesis class S protein [Papiliotrema laurentii]
MGSPERPTSSDSSGSRPQPSPRELTERLNPSVSTRLLVVLSFPLVLLLAVPFWWYTTSITRLPLPTARIEALELSTPIDARTTVLFTADTQAFPTPPPGRAVFEHSQITSAIAREVTKSADGILLQQRPDTRGKRLWDLVVDPVEGQVPTLRIHIRYTDRANASFPLHPYIQEKESGLMTTGLPAGTCVIPVHPSQLGDNMLNKHYQIAVLKSLMALFPSLPSPPAIPLRALKYSPNVTLSFVLLNEDSTVGSYVRDWDVEAAIKDHLAPHLSELADVFNFTIESQILYHAPLSFSPTYGQIESAWSHSETSVEGTQSDDVDIAKAKPDGQQDEAWRVTEADMKIFVNSERWSLDSGSTNNPVLRFLLFVPSAHHRPMRLAVPDLAQSFLLPQYGAVTLLNPPASASSARSFHLPLETLAEPFHLFTQHLYSLLALPTNPPYIEHALTPSPLLPSSLLTPPLSPWQVEQIYRMRTKENSEEARKTLAGIVRLVKKIKEMKVGEGVRNKVLGAVEKLEKLDHTTDSRQAFLLSRDAVTLANEAFFDPSMMGLLYFPDEHKFAVYTPLFAPIALPMLVGLVRELFAWRRRRLLVVSAVTESPGQSFQQGLSQ